jgi:hypothetical protein
MYVCMCVRTVYIVRAKSVLNFVNGLFVCTYIQATAFLEEVNNGFSALGGRPFHNS